ncbi:MAG: hypothetical protein ACTSPV_05930 [Candidatus Hodarchaeales archaeon]
MRIIQIKFICPKCHKLKKENRFACADEEENKKAEKKVFKQGFICQECWKKEKMPFRFESLINKRNKLAGLKSRRQAIENS